MHTGAVITQVNSLEVCLATKAAAVTLLPGMCVPVLNQMTSLSKCFTTGFAHKRLCSRMNAFMKLQRLLVDETLTTHGTSKLP